ncbi:MAG TPA: LytTR family DNA-binding domain-containing protein, partial [Chitinophagaceae bacterium]
DVKVKRKRLTAAFPHLTKWLDNKQIRIMNKLKAIIIDDEIRSRESLKQKILLHCSDVEIIAECENGEQGIKAIEEKKPDIVFLDVEMPRMNGFTMLQHLSNRNFELIFTTAYDHYAIRAIKFSALDYLVKPVEVEELCSAVEMVKEKHKHHTANERLETLLYNLMQEKNQSNRIAIPSLEGLQFVEVNDIILLEAESNYTVIYIKPLQKITVSKTLKDFEELLPHNIFIRIHHSYIINKNHVQKYLKGEGGQVIMSNGRTLDVARRKKEEFMKAIGY